MERDRAIDTDEAAKEERKEQKKMMRKTSLSAGKLVSVVVDRLFGETPLCAREKWCALEKERKNSWAQSNEPSIRTSNNCAIPIQL